MSEEQALTLLTLLKLAGLPMAAAIKAAFSDRVKAAADGNGGYSGDMDLLTLAKETLLTKAHERAVGDLQSWERELARMRERAAKEEAEEDQRRHEREARQRERAAQTQEPESQESHDPVAAALHLLECCSTEVDTLAAQEQHLLSTLSTVQSRRAELEKKIQATHAIAEQLRAINELAEQVMTMLGMTDH
jgi:hypothetical protein